MATIARMARVEVASEQAGVPSAWVHLAGITDAEVVAASQLLRDLVAAEAQISDAVAKAFLAIVQICPAANPSDLWQHVISRQFRLLPKSDQQWKRVSGFALERAFLQAYNPLLAQVDDRMRIIPRDETVTILGKLGVLGSVKATKIDLFLEGFDGKAWRVFGAVHAKSSLAERIQDDVPASLAFMKAGLLSVVLTMDSKSFPPPHGDGVNHGELGGRLPEKKKSRPKREYVEVDGQFDALFSFNLRTPESPDITPSGRRIHTLPFAGAAQPDAFVSFVADAWLQRI
jgi:hypothetical protein